MTAAEAFQDLIDRLENAAGVLQSMAVAKENLGHTSDYDRLRGKVEGVRLALDYVRQYSVTTLGGDA